MSSSPKKVAGLVLVNAIVFFLLFESVAALFLRHKIQILYPSYWKLSFLSPDQGFGKGYPRGYFVADKAKGFDIAKAQQPIAVHSIPPEAGEYSIWSNDLGCFDELDRSGKPYAVYLAGDSQTWGYSPFSAKFGSLLQDRLGKPVAKCGVTHTGQRHQFQKFLEVSSQLGYFPPVVVVNVVPNDLTNDYLFPEATEIDGYLVNQARLAGDSSDSPSQVRTSRDELQEIYRNFRSGLSQSRLWKALDPRHYFASAVLAAEVLKRSSSPAQKTEPAPAYPINSALGAPNRQVFKAWAEHSRQHGYQLIVTSATMEQPGFYTPLGGFLKGLNIPFWDFSEAANDKGLQLGDVRWKRDGHFNPSGNVLYAEFLHDRLSSL